MRDPANPPPGRVFIFASELLTASPEELQFLVPRLRVVNSCAICSSAQLVAWGACWPDEPWRFAAAPPTAGKVRTFYYGLCEACFSLPDRDRCCDLAIVKVYGGSL